MGGKSNNQNSSSSNNSSSSTEFSLVTITAVVHHYNADTQKWIVVGPARVGIYHDTEANSFRIVARRIGEESHEVVANCPVGETFSYNESTPSFHQWRDQVGPISGPGPSRVLGVKFGSTEEGALFADTIRRILATFESVHRMMLESGAAAAVVEDGGHHPHIYHPQNYHHNQYSHQHQQQQQLPPQNPPPPVPGSSSSSGGGSQSSSSSLYGRSGDQPPHFAAAAVLQRGKPVPPPPPPPSLNGGSLKNGGGAPVNGSGSSSNNNKPAIQPKPGFLSEMEITLARRRAKIEAADGGGGVGGSEVEISLNGRDHHQPVLPILSRKNSTSEQLSTFAPLNKPVNGLHPSNSFSNPSSPSIEQQQPIGVNGSPQMMSPLAIEKLKQEILGEIRQEFAAFKVDLLQVIKEQMSGH